MKRTTPPEEKLLKLIREGASAQGAQSLPARPSPAPARRRLDLKMRVRDFRQSLAQLGARQYILIGYCVAGVYLAAGVLYPLYMPRALTAPAYKPSSRAAAVPAAEKPLSYYQQAVEGRPIFSGESTTGALGVGAVNPELVKDLTVIGIIAGNNPQVVIEDKRTQRTYTLNKGQAFGDFIVDDIREGAVSVSYRGQRFELYL